MNILSHIPSHRPHISTFLTALLLLMTYFLTAAPNPSPIKSISWTEKTYNAMTYLEIEFDPTVAKSWTFSYTNPESNFIQIGHYYDKEIGFINTASLLGIGTCDYARPPQQDTDFAVYQSFATRYKVDVQLDAMPCVCSTGIAPLSPLPSPTIYVTPVKYDTCTLPHPGNPFVPIYNIGFNNTLNQTVTTFSPETCPLLRCGPFIVQANGIELFNNPVYRTYLKYITKLSTLTNGILQTGEFLPSIVSFPQEITLLSADVKYSIVHRHYVNSHYPWPFPFNANHLDLDTDDPTQGRRGTGSITRNIYTELQMDITELPKGLYDIEFAVFPNTLTGNATKLVYLPPYFDQFWYSSQLLSSLNTTQHLLSLNLTSPAFSRDSTQYHYHSFLCSTPTRSDPIGTTPSPRVRLFQSIPSQIPSEDLPLLHKETSIAYLQTLQYWLNDPLTFVIVSPNSSNTDTVIRLESPIQISTLLFEDDLDNHNNHTDFTQTNEQSNKIRIQILSTNNHNDTPKTRINLEKYRIFKLKPSAEITRRISSKFHGTNIHNSLLTRENAMMKSFDTTHNDTTKTDFMNLQRNTLSFDPDDPGSYIYLAQAINNNEFQANDTLISLTFGTMEIINPDPIPDTNLQQFLSIYTKHRPLYYEKAVSILEGVLAGKHAQIMDLHHIIQQSAAHGHLPTTLVASSSHHIIYEYQYRSNVALITNSPQNNTALDTTQHTFFSQATDSMYLRLYTDSEISAANTLETGPLRCYIRVLTQNSDIDVTVRIGGTTHTQQISLPYTTIDTHARPNFSNTVTDHYLSHYLAYINDDHRVDEIMWRFDHFLPPPYSSQSSMTLNVTLSINKYLNLNAKYPLMPRYKDFISIVDSRTKNVIPSTIFRTTDTTLSLLFNSPISGDGKFLFALRVQPKLASTQGIITTPFYMSMEVRYFGSVLAQYNNIPIYGFIGSYVLGTHSRDFETYSYAFPFTRQPTTTYDSQSLTATASYHFQAMYMTYSGVVWAMTPSLPLPNLADNRFTCQVSLYSSQYTFYFVENGSTRQDPIVSTSLTFRQAFVNGEEVYIAHWSQTINVRDVIKTKCSFFFLSPINMDQTYLTWKFIPFQLILDRQSQTIRNYGKNYAETTFGLDPNDVDLHKWDISHMNGPQSARFYLPLHNAVPISLQYYLVRVCTCYKILFYDIANYAEMVLSALHSATVLPAAPGGTTTPTTNLTNPFSDMRWEDIIIVNIIPQQLGTEIEPFFALRPWDVTRTRTCFEFTHQNFKFPSLNDHTSPYTPELLAQQFAQLNINLDKTFSLTVCNPTSPSEIVFLTLELETPSPVIPSCTGFRSLGRGSCPKKPFGWTCISDEECGVSQRMKQQMVCQTGVCMTPNLADYIFELFYDELYNKQPLLDNYSQQFDAENIIPTKLSDGSIYNYTPSNGQMPHFDVTF